MSILGCLNTPFCCFSLSACFFFLFQTRGFSYLPFPHVFCPFWRHALFSFSLFRVLFALLEDTQIYTFSISACLRLILRHADSAIQQFCVSIFHCPDTKITLHSISSCLYFWPLTRRFRLLSILRVSCSKNRHESLSIFRFFVSYALLADTKTQCSATSSCPRPSPRTGGFATVPVSNLLDHPISVGGRESRGEAPQALLLTLGRRLICCG